ncbi:MAG: hypothetical protein ACLGQX_08990, partial [Acidobacteriota bacterium]
LRASRTIFFPAPRLPVAYRHWKHDASPGQPSCYPMVRSFKAASARLLALASAETGAYGLCLDPVMSEQNQKANLKSHVPFFSALAHGQPQSAYHRRTLHAVVERWKFVPSILHLVANLHADRIVLGTRRASSRLDSIPQEPTPFLLAKTSCPVRTIAHAK